MSAFCFTIPSVALSQLEESGDTAGTTSITIGADTAAVGSAAGEGNLSERAHGKLSSSVGEGSASFSAAASEDISNQKVQNIAGNQRRGRTYLFLPLFSLMGAGVDAFPQTIKTSEQSQVRRVCSTGTHA